MSAVVTEYQHVNIGDTRLYIAERGSGYPLIILHGGPGLDHHMFGDYLDALADEFHLILVDQRAQGLSDDCPTETWTLEQMAKDVKSLADALGLEKYAILGHSYGAFVALQNAVDFPGAAAQTIVSSGLPGAKYLENVWKNLEKFEPIELREQVTRSWEHEKDVQTKEDVKSLLHDQLPFQFADPFDPRIPEFEKRTVDGIPSAEVLRFFANADYGGIEVEDKLNVVSQPVLVLAGRMDRTCVVEGAEAMADGLPNAELVVFENSGHMTFVEENEKYIQSVRKFLNSNKQNE
ncbi:MAG TPA: alpha/beta fold hydrolase [Anaerolineales bacterium]|nr:alpha/beta fold hydrolase [Anaerolineales bacterium]